MQNLRLFGMMISVQLKEKVTLDSKLHHPSVNRFHPMTHPDFANNLNPLTIQLNIDSISLVPR